MFLQPNYYTENNHFFFEAEKNCNGLTKGKLDFYKDLVKQTNKMPKWNK